MAPLTDPAILDQFREALREWNCEGFVQWKRIAAAWVDERLKPQTTRSVAKLLHEYVDSGGIIDEQIERREVHRDRHRFHYDFRILIDRRKIYIETTLEQSSTGPIVTIVSIHDA